MAGFPNYDAAAIEALDRQAEAILGVFRARGYGRVEPSVLQPAEIFLDRSGEEIRRRTFVLTDPSGRDLCLRPELTIPVCRMHAERGGKYPARLCYNGLAFRHQPGAPDRPTQFYQAGAELFGVADRKATDGEGQQDEGKGGVRHQRPGDRGREHDRPRHQSHPEPGRRLAGKTAGHRARQG